MTPHCACGAIGIRNERHDAYYCAACDVWLEKRCSAADTIEPLTGEMCHYCHSRPDKPSMASMEPYT